MSLEAYILMLFLLSFDIIIILFPRCIYQQVQRDMRSYNFPHLPTCLRKHLLHRMTMFLGAVYMSVRRVSGSPNVLSPKCSFMTTFADMILPWCKVMKLMCGFQKDVSSLVPKGADICSSFERKKWL